MKSLLIFAFMLIVVTNNLLSIDSKSEIPVPFKEKVSFPSILSEELPEDFPEMRIETVDSPFPGYIFMECFNVNGSEPNYIMITDELGSVVYYSKKENQGADFKMQPNGRYSYASRVKLGDKYQAGPLTVQNIMVQHNIMDSEFNVIDTIQMQNEYLADMHEFVILPNGNYLMLSYEGVPVDMSKVIPGGNPNAKVVGTVLQEVDKDNKCVFQWKSLDYIPILATKDDVRKQTFEHVHGNSMFLDKDGNLIVSFPTSFEIVKIDMVTGELIWRFGGDENDFEISGDNPTDAPYYFRMQHDAHRLDNGNLIFYDNAVMKKSGWSSRAVEYEFDEENRKANLVWEYKHDPPVSAYAMGSVQRLDNGNTLINWGLNFTGLHRTMTEVTHDKSITYELSMPSLTFSYRAQKNNLPPCEPVADIDKFEMLQGNTYDFSDDDENTGVTIKFNQLDGFIYNMINVKKYKCAPLDPVFDGEPPVILNAKFLITPQMINSHQSVVMFDLSLLPPHYSPELLKVYVKSENADKFNELVTNYDAASNRITAVTESFGEFIVGFNRETKQIMPPTLAYPKDEEQLLADETIILKWSATGRTDNFILQIARDSDFENILFDFTDNQSSLRYIYGLNIREYFWRVKSVYRDIESDWSPVRKFTLGDKFLTITSPNGGEIFEIDSSYIIRWETNLNDSLKIELLFEDEVVSTIEEGIFSYYNSYKWTVPNTLSMGDFYKIRISSIKDGTMVAESDDYFIIPPPVSVEYTNSLFDSNIIISPNPSDSWINIALPDYLRIGDAENISVLSMLGTDMRNEVKILGNFAAGAVIKMDINSLPAGIYIIKIANRFQKFIKY